MESGTVKHIVILLAAILVVAAIGILFYVRFNHSVPQTTSQQTSVNTNPPATDLQNSTEQLYTQTQISPPPQVASQQVIDASALPAELSGLIAPNPTYEQIQQVKFAN